MLVESGEAAEGIFEPALQDANLSSRAVTWPGQVAGYLGCETAHSGGGRRDETSGEEEKLHERDRGKGEIKNGPFRGQ